jgi:SecD/SecF fusion protein
MLGKKFIRFFTILLAVVFLGQFLLTIPTNKVEREADAVAKKEGEASSPAYKIARGKYLDDLSGKTIFSIPYLKNYTYQDLKKQQLALGLDLKGGMSVVLQVDLFDFVNGLSKNSQDPAFTTAMNNAKTAMQKGGSDFITTFGNEYKKANGTSLAAIFSRNEVIASKGINLESTDAQVIAMLKSSEFAQSTVKSTYDRLKERIDEFGVTQPNVSLDAARDLIVVELPGVDNPKRARELLTATAKLEFWDVYRFDQNIANGMMAADNRAKMIMNKDTSATTKSDTTRGPIFQNLNMAQGGSALVGFADKGGVKTINEYLQNKSIKALFPKDLVLAFSQKPDKAGKFALYSLKAKRGTSETSNDRAALNGDVVTDATVQTDEKGEVSVSLKMNDEGKRKWGELTTAAAADNQRPVAVVLDGTVVSAPSVNTPIMDGNSSITGSYTVEEANDFARVLKIGRLPAGINIIQESVIGPSLGEENINKSYISLIIGLLAIILLMCTYYSTAGVISIVALLVNIFFIIGALTSYGTVLTLPGIAGIVLTMAAAVDANVIIYERCREELAEGKGLLAAIRDGFKHSYPAIFDANISNLIIAFVMAYFGLGPIKGFAVVLIIGIFSTLFTAVFVCQWLMEMWFNRTGKMSFSASWSQKLLSGIKYDWVGKRKYAYMISGAFILAGLVSFFVRGFDLGVDFKGGYSYNVEFAQDVNVDQLRASLESKLGGTPIVKAIDTKNSFNIITTYGLELTGAEATEKVIAQVFEGVKGVSPNSTLEDFRNQSATGKTHITAFSKVGSYVADDIRKSATWALGLSLLLIFIYIAIRFNKWQFSAGAVLALFHDVLLVMSFFTLFHGILPFSMEIDQAFVAAILTVVGYSMNDTIVVYDRIREFIHNYKGRSNAEIINDAINNTLSRTIMTSFITFLSMLILFVMGGSSVRGFAFALLIGIIVGTYSSIFVATPIMMDLTKENLSDAPNVVEAVKKEVKA